MVKRKKQRSTKHYTENKRTTNIKPIKKREWTQVLHKVSSSCSTSGIRRVTNPVIKHEWGKNGEQVEHMRVRLYTDIP
jgi:hypothetical protein